MIKSLDDIIRIINKLNNLPGIEAMLDDNNILDTCNSSVRYMMPDDLYDELQQVELAINHYLDIETIDNNRIKAKLTSNGIKVYSIKNSDRKCGLFTTAISTDKFTICFSL